VVIGFSSAVPTPRMVRGARFFVYAFQKFAADDKF
jgi:hypothetical protein